MHGLSEETYNKIIKLINKYPNIQFKLFGSRAKGKEKFNSDIDIAVFGQLQGKEIFNIKNDFDLLDIPYKIDLVFVNEISKQALLEVILNEGVDF
ncbi:MAG: nucleotidyltransferase domain-containing protein [Oscillospiraceae bacterium]|nr:nucleotidyltransferase domain-containing protein [Oscillospiraceae bacterium]